MDIKERLLPMYAISLIVLLAEIFVEGLELNGQVTQPNATCNIFEGSWVHDDSYPLYNSSKCLFINFDHECHHPEHKRNDNFYMHYRWQPYACNIPKFNAEDFLRMLKGKNIMFVGDKLSENMWLSLICMIHSAHLKVQYTLENNDDGVVEKFRIPAYNVSILGQWDYYLVDQGGDPERGLVVYLDKIKDDKVWKNQDMLIFNSWHGWFQYKSRISFQIGNQTIKDMNLLVAFEKAVRTWANWIDSNIDPSKTKVFYQGVSPEHMNGNEWGDPSAKTCKMEEKPVQGSIYPGGPHPAEIVVKKVLKSMKTPVYLLDVTRLSQLRKDGHPGRDKYENGGMNCINWCLPGVPDTWNELFYAALLQS